MKFSIPIYIFTGLAAFAMAAVAAFFSITGLAALYAGAAVAVIVMGSCIEFSKIVATVWLHHFWKKSNFLMVSILTLMVAASMAVTSGGVYGFLTGSHASQEAPAQQQQMIIERYDQQIKVEQDKIAQDQNRLKSLDSIVSTSLTQGKFGGRSADSINRRQTSERSAIQTEIDESYKRIDALSAEKLKVSQAQAESDVKLGAVKYLAALFGANPSNAVMYFTLVMVLLLDPFAIVLVIATQIAYEKRNGAGDQKEQTDPIKKELDIPEIPVHIEEAIDDDKPLPDLFETGDSKTDTDLVDDVEKQLEDDKDYEFIKNISTNLAKEKIVEFFNDDEVKEGINNAADETIVEIDQVINSDHITDNEKVEQVIKALDTTLSADKMKEVKRRWLD